MLQRRIGMIWTRSGWAVWTRPRANSRSDRSLRLAVMNDRMGMVRLKADPTRIVPSRVRFDRTQPLQPFADLERPVEDRSHRDEPEKPMPRDRGESRRRDAAALAAVGRTAELARCDARLEIRGHAPRRSREHALIRRFRRVCVHLDQPSG